MGANHWAQPLSAPCRRGQIVTGLALGPRANLSHAVDDDEAFQAGPVVPRLQPGDVVNDGHATRLDAAM